MLKMVQLVLLSILSDVSVSLDAQDASNCLLIESLNAQDALINYDNYQ